MKIAILGSRGIPAGYGGFETFAQEVSIRLVRAGHEVDVYCCGPYSLSRERYYEGVRRVILPTIRSKHLEKPLCALLSLLHVSFTNADAVLMLGVSVSSLCFIPRLFGKKIAVNIDGLEWQRKKWGWIASFYLRLSERTAGLTCNKVVTDAEWIREYYREKYGKEALYIPYGSTTEKVPPGPTLAKFGLAAGDYILYAGRFEKENNPLLVREAFDEIENPQKKLVMIGDAPFAEEYIAKVKATKNPAVVFTGALYGKAYRELLSSAFFYIQAGEVGGTHPALVEAMGAGNCVLANDVPEHREVLKNAGFYFSGKEDLKSKIEYLIKNERVLSEKRREALELARDHYSWEAVTKEYEGLFCSMIAGR